MTRTLCRPLRGLDQSLGDFLLPRLKAGAKLLLPASRAVSLASLPERRNDEIVFGDCSEQSSHGEVHHHFHGSPVPWLGMAWSFFREIHRSKTKPPLPDQTLVRQGGAASCLLSTVLCTASSYFDACFFALSVLIISAGIVPERVTPWESRSTENLRMTETSSGAFS